MEAKKPRKAKSKQTVVTVGLAPDVCERIDDIVSKLEWTRAMWIRSAIREKLEREEEPQKKLL